MWEDVLQEDETTGYKDSLPAFHGYSADGFVEAEYVYVGYVISIIDSGVSM